MKILVALDGSDTAFNSMKSVCSIASKTGSYITAFYVNKGKEYSPEETGWTAIKDRLDKEFETFGQDVMRRAYEIGRAAGVPVEGYVSDGIPTTEILNYVKAHGIIKLIAMGHSSKGRGTQEFAENTTRNVIMQSSLPVFVTSREIEIRNITIAIDDPDVSGKITRFGGFLSKSLGADIRILTIIPEAEGMVNEYRLIAEVPNIERHIEASEKATREVFEKTSAAAYEILLSMGIKASATVKKSSTDDIISSVSAEEMVIIGIKGDPSNKKLSKTASKFLHSHNTSALFVQ